MSPDTIYKRIFLFLLLLIISFGLIGCHGVKYEWLPEHKHEHQIIPKDKSTQDVSKIEANILKVKF
jgi:hypothetical protein